MPEMTWERLEHPILAEIAELTKRGQRGPGASEIVRATGLDDTDVRVALSRLYDSQYVTGTRLRNAGYGQGFQNLHLTERGLRAAGVWPNDDPFASLVAALQAQIDREPDDERKGKLRRLLEAVVGAGRDVTVGVLTTVLSEMARP